jgi:Transposase IS116/IS110/IS902 family.
MTKIGRPQLRKAFFLTAMVALRYNPIIKSFGERLRASVKTKMQINGAAMRKLIHIVYGVLKNGVPFDEKFFVKIA